jgi:predicted transcriptional regulator YheO
MDIAAQMVTFLGKACGENCEVVLQDLREGKKRIMAIANGQISGRSLGAPLTDLARRLITQGVWKKQDSICNYEGKTRDNRLLRSSTFFIKQGDSLLGMLSVNIDTSKYTQLSENILRLAGLNPPAAQPVIEAPGENFYDSMDGIIKAVLIELKAEAKPRGRLTLDERILIVERLMDQGIFLLRGSVSRVAETLQCSEATLYRYIGMINKKRKSRNS